MGTGAEPNAAGPSGLTLTMSNQIVDKASIKTPPPFFAHFFLMATGNWLKLGDSDSDDVKSQASNEQINVSLVAALLFTVTTSYLFGIDEFDWDFVESKWGANAALVSHELQLIISLSASVATILATLSSVVILMVSGELANNEEASRFQQIMGLRQSIGFQFLMIGCVETGCLCLIHLVIFSYNDLATLVAMPIFGVLTIITLFGSFLPALDSLYRIKYAVHTSKPSSLSVGELGEYVSHFCDEFGVGNLTEKAVVQYISIMRDRDAVRDPTLARRGSITSRGGMKSILSPSSQQLLRALVEQTMARYVEEQMVRQGRGIVESIIASA